MKGETPPGTGGLQQGPGGVAMWEMPTGDRKGLAGEVVAPSEGFSWLFSMGASSLRVAGC